MMEPSHSSTSMEELLDPPTSSMEMSPSSQSSGASSSASSPNSTPTRKVKSLREIYESCNFALMVAEPTSFTEASTMEGWNQAMKEEINAIERNRTWDLVELPYGKTVIGLKWIYKTKYNADGSIQKHKARLVAKGYAQQQGIDFFETFSPVARSETVRIILALAAHKKWDVFQFDVQSAFLNGELDQEVYVEQPQGFVVGGMENKVYKLKKALYGLKQAPRAWYSRIDIFLHQNGFHRSKSEPTLYLKMQELEEMLIVCIYVDDIIYTGSSKKLIENFKELMMKEFEMSDLGLLHYFLGLEVHQTKQGIFISQGKYVYDLLKKFRMSNCNATSTPMNANERLTNEDGSGRADAKVFRSIVGRLIYLTHTRPNIVFAVSFAFSRKASPWSSKKDFAICLRDNEL